MPQCDAHAVLSSHNVPAPAMNREDHARRDAIQACVLLVSAKFGDAAGEWLLRELARLEAETKGPLPASLKGDTQHGQSRSR